MTRRRAFLLTAVLAAIATSAWIVDEAQARHRHRRHGGCRTAATCCDTSYATYGSGGACCGSGYATGGYAQSNCGPCSGGQSYAAAYGEYSAPSSCCQPGPSMGAGQPGQAVPPPPTFNQQGQPAQPAPSSNAPGASVPPPPPASPSAAPGAAPGAGSVPPPPPAAPGVNR